ncbi:MAG: hypothetical protein PUB21_00705 [Bacteroidales bacterium]|nr:hypothetical protein [Bacteroidales bacterium]
MKRVVVSGLPSFCVRTDAEDTITGKGSERIVCPYCGSFLIEVSPVPPAEMRFRRPCPKCKRDVTALSKGQGV